MHARPSGGFRTARGRPRRSRHQTIFRRRFCTDAPSLQEKGNVMPTRDSYPQGTPNWVDLQTTDQAAAKAFYAGVFGWSYDDQPMDGGAVYSIARIGDESVAAIAPQSPELAAAGAPPM